MTELHTQSATGSIVELFSKFIVDLAIDLLEILSVYTMYAEVNTATVLIWIYRYTCIQPW